MQRLLKAISHGKPWLDQFNRCDYENAFGQYRALHEAAFVSAVQTGRSPEQMAEELLDAVEESWKRERFWNRKIAHVNDKMMLIVYLTPLLLATREMRCAELAQAICAAWKRRFPGDGYELSEYDKIADGFRNSIMGFDLDNRKK